MRVSDMFYACFDTNADLIRTSNSWPGIFFLSMFLLSYTLLMLAPIQFTLDLGSSGGLALSPQGFGYAQRTVSVFDLTIGDMLSIWSPRKIGFDNTLPLMASVTCIPLLFYIYLSYTLPTNVGWVACYVFITQMACEFGLCVYMYCLVHYNEVRRVSTYALCMSLTMVSAMIPMMLSGSFQQTLSYRRLFTLTTLSGICTLIISVLMAVDKKLMEEGNGSTEKKTVRR